ncbi:hypothetical protein MHBO_004426 [Bonamia ostreae]|uniref:subtilisin n=1 Tax=Bonamia ostreae TaxID=126728 RepID=A0ABV2AT95_9EUKA
MKKIRSSNNKTDQTHYTNKFVESLGQASFQIYKPEQLHETKNDTSFYSKDYKYNAHVPTGVWLTGAPLLWQQGYTGKGCTVGVIDTGIDPTHNDLQSLPR